MAPTCSPSGCSASLSTPSSAASSAEGVGQAASSPCTAATTTPLPEVRLGGGQEKGSRRLRKGLSKQAELRHCVDVGLHTVLLKCRSMRMVMLHVHPRLLMLCFCCTHKHETHGGVACDFCSCDHTAHTLALAALAAPLPHLHSTQHMMCCQGSG